MTSAPLLKILIIDDSELITGVMKRFFEDYDFSVIVCDNGLSGIKHAVEDKPDFIFLDLSMPRIDGFDTIKVLKTLQETKNIPVIIITAHSDSFSINESIKLGATKVIVKPIQKKVIVAELENLLGQPLLTRIKTQKIFSASNSDFKNNDFTPTGSSQLLSSKIRNFIKSIDERKNLIEGYLGAGNFALLKSAVYELITLGNELGYPRLSNLSEYIHRQLIKDSNNLDLEEIKSHTEKLLNYLTELKVY